MPVYSLAAITDVSLTAATAKSLVGFVTPATRRAKVRGIVFGGNSVTQTDPPVLLEILIGNTTAGTNTAQTPRPIDPAETASLCTGGANWTVEPSAGTALVQWADRVSPIGGTLVYDIPVDQRPTVPVSTVCVLRATSGSALTSVRGGLIFEE